MRFGKTLRKSVYEPWKADYIDYAKLKAILREDEDDQPWTEDDEKDFCEEILNVQLDKVAAFQVKTFKELEQRANKAAEKLRELAPEDGRTRGDITMGRFKEVDGELDTITNEIKELKKYGSINYTGFLKIVKKHDRKRGNSYKIRPMIQKALSERPFNSEEVYTPLLEQLSSMYFVVRQQLDESSDQPSTSTPDAQSQMQNAEKYTAYKFWIHPDNLLEVKTFILRRLPILIFSDKTSKDGLAAPGDPTLNSLYFDNSDFSLYSQKVDRQVDATSLRIRWYGQLNSNPDLVLEQKIIHENGSSEERRIPIKEKYIQAFIKGDYKMEKSMQKMERQGQPVAKIEEFKNTVSDIQNFVLENNLQPVLRANYTRTAFQKPLDDRVRISIDTQVAFIREDALDIDRPCRDPENWHRLDVDNGAMTYPFSNINRGEVSRFPFSILEIKVKDGGSSKSPQWVEDLKTSHLVYPAARFSKFVHGVATLFEDQVNNYPGWLVNIGKDIRQDPQEAFDEEEKRKAKKAEDEAAIGSLLATSKLSASHKAATASPMGRSYLQERIAADERAGRRSDFTRTSKSQDTATEDEGEPETGGYGTMASVFPSFSLSRYAQSRREREASVALPPGVTKPLHLMKDDAELSVEPKVWLANERTFIKWQHIAVIMAAFSLTLFNASAKSTITAVMSYIYLLIALFTAGWGFYIHGTRLQMIQARSGRDFDNILGPLVVAFAMVVSLIVNFSLRWQEANTRFNSPGGNATSSINGVWEDAANLELGMKG